MIFCVISIQNTQGPIGPGQWKLGLNSIWRVQLGNPCGVFKHKAELSHLAEILHFQFGQGLNLLPLCANLAYAIYMLRFVSSVTRFRRIGVARDIVL
jgi:hypothetical protein